MLKWLFKKKIVEKKTNFSKLDVGEQFKKDDVTCVKIHYNKYQHHDSIHWRLVTQDFEVERHES